MLDGSEVDRRVQMIKDDIVERTHHMKSLCHEAETTGIETVITLADQGEQLQTINMHLSSIDTTLVDTHQHLNRLKGITQRFIDTLRLKFDRKLRWKAPLRSSRSKDISQLTLRRQTAEATSKRLEQSLLRSHSLTDETLVDIERALHRLKDLAQDMNEQLGGQTETLGEIHQRMQISSHHIEQQNREIQKIM